MGTELAFGEMMKESLIKVQGALPKDFNIERFTQNALAMLGNNQQLKDFAIKNKSGSAQIKAGLMRGAYLGLDAMNKEFHLVPFKDTLNFMLDYRGAEKLCKKYSIRPIKDIYAKLVREGDYFEEGIKDNELCINFRPKPFNNGNILGGLAVCKFMDGGIKYETMSLEEMNKCRSKSRASNSMAWAEFPETMYAKTVLHRLCKHIELDFDSVEQRQEFDNDVAIETDPQEVRNNKVQQNANSVDFEFEDAEVKPVEQSSPFENVDTSDMPFNKK